MSKWVERGKEERRGKGGMEDRESSLLALHVWLTLGLDIL